MPNGGLVLAMGNRHGHPAAERMKYPIGLIGGMQIVVKKPGDCLTLIRLGSSRGRTAAYPRMRLWKQN